MHGGITWGTSNVWNGRRAVTIRPTTQEERDRLASGRHPRFRYVCWLPESERYAAAFGMPLGGRSKAEAVFWAEHWALKQDGEYVAPAGWEHIEGRLE